jgi:hypothetical protein
MCPTESPVGIFTSLTGGPPSDPRLLAVRLQFCTWLNLDRTRLLAAGD